MGHSEGRRVLVAFILLLMSNRSMISFSVSIALCLLFCLPKQFIEIFKFEI